MRFCRTITVCLVLLTLRLRPVWADDARFDLAGPKIDISVKRDGRTLPIAEVPNLLPADELDVQADLPDTQSNRLVVVVAFLRGTTNEPPDDWFFRIETWKSASRQPRRILVPNGAQRALIFVAPATGGDFDTLRSVVKRNPGLFLQASDALFETSLEQQRIQLYLTSMRVVAQDEAKVIADRSSRLASALALMPNEDCFKKPVEDQVRCLGQASAPMLLDSGSEHTISAAISTGTSSDLINAASQTDGGIYSAYVGTVIDLVHLVGQLHTAQYRYIPALTLPTGSVLNTQLNAPPSFGNPKSVIVIALPPIGPSRVPDLHLEDQRRVFCLRNSSMVLPLLGIPVLYSTSFAHDLSLDFSRHGQQRVVPLLPDVLAGGLTLTDERRQAPASQIVRAQDSPDKTVTRQAVLRGYWGFDAFEGPTLTFQEIEGAGWRLVGEDLLIAGRGASLQVRGSATACLRSVSIASPGQPAEALPFTPLNDGQMISMTLPPSENTPGSYSLQLLQHGSVAPVTLGLKLYADNGVHVTGAFLNPDHRSVRVTGISLDSVDRVQVGDATFVAAKTPAARDREFLLQDQFPAASPSSASILFKDGLRQEVALSAEDPSAVVDLLTFQTTSDLSPAELPVELRSNAAIPLHSVLHFVVSSHGRFLLSDRIEVATLGGGAHAMLSFQTPGDTLILEDSQTAVGKLDVDRAFGESAFGPLRLRAVRASGEAGPWIPLGTLVRRPHLTEASCSAGVCTLRGQELFLIDALSTKEDFQDPIVIPRTTATDELSFPVAATHVHTIFLRLRDDTSAIAVVRIQAHRP